MLDLIKKFISSNRELILLFFFIPSLLIIINSSFLIPIIVSIIMSYFLYNFKKLFLFFGFTKNIAFIATYLSFITVFLLILFILMPIVFKQLVSLFDDLPFIIQKVKFLADKFVNKYPSIFSIEQTNLLFSNVITYVQTIGKTIISASLLSIAFTIKIILYVFFVPIFIFFFLKDYEIIIFSFKELMPQKFYFLESVWRITNKQIENYIRGKLFELLLVTFVNYLLFKYYDLTYPDLLSFVVGLSVFMPYIGTIIVSIPVVLIASVQFGLSKEFFYFLSFYSFLQFLDGNLLVPILFSEVVDLHPMAIIMSIVIFGALFNLYGVIFAIPLAIIVKAIIILYLTPVKDN